MIIKLKKLVLMNWGPFHGNAEVDFSLDDAKQVTYILGYNSAGKTTIFNALYWCLFNEPKSDEVKSFINKEGLKNNEGESSVRLKFYLLDNYGNRTDYDLTRLLKYTTGKVDDELVPKSMQSDFRADKTIQGSSLPESVGKKDFEALMDNLIPAGPRPFFFLNGEKLASLFTRDNFRKLEAYANAISDINIIDKIIKKLDGTYDAYNDKLAKSTRITEGIRKAQNDLEKKKDEKIKSEEWRDELRGKLESNRSLKESLYKECAKYEEMKPRLERISTFEGEKKVNQALHDEKERDFREFLNSNLSLLYLETHLKWCENELNRLETYHEIPPKIPIDVIDTIFSSNPPKCICGREIDVEIRANFEKVKNQIPDKELSSALEKFRAELSINLRDIPIIRSNLEKRVSEIRKLNILINDLTTKIDIERTYVPKGLEKTNILEKFRKLNEVSGNIVDLEGQISRVDDSITVITAKINTIKQQLESQLQKDCAMKEIGAKMVFLRDARECMEAAKRQVRLSMLKHVKQFTSEGFRKLIWDPSNWKEISISDDWTVSAISSKDDKFPCFSLSEGQRHVLGIAFMSSLGKVTGNIIPFIFDSPFGRISEEPIKNIGKNIPPLMEGRQVVLLVTDTESANIRKHVEEIIGNEYVIEKISASESRINRD